MTLQCAVHIQSPIHKKYRSQLEYFPTPKYLYAKFPKFLYIQDHARAESTKISQDRRILTFDWLIEINESAPRLGQVGFGRSTEIFNLLLKQLFKLHLLTILSSLSQPDSIDSQHSKSSKRTSIFDIGPQLQPFPSGSSSHLQDKTINLG